MSGPWTSIVAALDGGRSNIAVCRRYNDLVSQVSQLRGEHFLLRRYLPLRGDDFMLRGDDFLLQGDDFLLRGEDFPRSAKNQRYV